MEKNVQKTKRIGLRKAFAVSLKVLNIIGIIIFAFVLIVTSWLAIDKFIMKSPVPSIAGYALLSVESGSMEGNMPDSIAKKDLILISKTNDYKIGETITFIRPDETIPTTHRIIDFDNSGGTREYITRGDANGFSRDANVTEDMILGEVIYIFHGMGALRGFVVDGGGYIFLIALALILFVGIVLLKMDGDQEIPLSETAGVEGEVVEEQTTRADGEDKS